MSETRINKEWDLGFLFDMAKQAQSSEDLKQCVKICERGLKEAKKNDDVLWVKEFNELHSKVKKTYLKKNVDALTKRATQEENIYRYKRARKFLEEAKKELNALFKMGKDGDKITKQIKKTERKIAELKEKELKDVPAIFNEEEEEDYASEYEEFKAEQSKTLENPIDPIADDMFYGTGEKEEKTPLEMKVGFLDEKTSLTENKKVKPSFPPKRMVEEVPEKLEKKLESALVKNFLEDDAPVAPKKRKERSQLVRQRNRALSEKLSAGEIQGTINQVKKQLDLAGYDLIKIIDEEGKEIPSYFEENNEIRTILYNNGTPYLIRKLKVNPPFICNSLLARYILRALVFEKLPKQAFLYKYIVAVLVSVYFKNVSLNFFGCTKC